MTATANSEMNQPTIVTKPVKGLNKDSSIRSIYSESLFLHGNEVLIQHSGNEYRLRRTRSGKLILTK
ncbi:MAG: hemin transporter HemP [Nitrosomonadaceae bacterium]|nr:hemin transporter HemP [Nitrosomonadaceae bacterium]|tara:strand:+ start:515 stop:715 length:201 start_codon:yes stop_codon:yes gene_type:complete